METPWRTTSESLPHVQTTATDLLIINHLPQDQIASQCFECSTDCPIMPVKCWRCPYVPAIGLMSSNIGARCIELRFSTQTILAAKKSPDKVASRFVTKHRLQSAGRYVHMMQHHIPQVAVHWLRKAKDTLAIHRNKCSCPTGKPLMSLGTKPRLPKKIKVDGDTVNSSGGTKTLVYFVLVYLADKIFL